MAFPAVSATSNGNSAGIAQSFSVTLPSGSETSSVTVTIAGGVDRGAAWACYRLTGTDSGTAPAISAVSAANTSTPNPPSLNPSGWDIEDTLWLAVYGWGADVAHSSFPSSYTNTLTDRYSDATDPAAVSLSSNPNAAASEDPGAGAIASTAICQSYTAAIRPGAANMEIFCFVNRASAAGQTADTPTGWTRLVQRVQNTHCITIFYKNVAAGGAGGAGSIFSGRALGRGRIFGGSALIC